MRILSYFAQIVKFSAVSLLQLGRGAINRLERRWFGFAAVVAREVRRGGKFYFIQVGANDGITVDPIRDYVLKHGWRGILVEPQKKCFAALQKNYAGVSGLHFENVAISDRAESKQLYVVDEKAGPEWGSLVASFKPGGHMTDEGLKVGTEEVRCETLATIVRKHALPRIDLLQVDTEGYDYEIVKSVDFDTMAPRIIHYEHRHMTMQEQFTLKALLQSRGYAVVEEGYDTTAHLRR